MKETVGERVESANLNLNSWQRCLTLNSAGGGCLPT